MSDRRTCDTIKASSKRGYFVLVTSMIERKSTSNWPVIGNEKVVEFLERSIISNKLANAYLFCGPGQLGKRLIAEIFAKSILCQDSKHKSAPCGQCAMCRQFEKKIHPDFLSLNVERGKKTISIESVRSFQHEFNTTSLLGDTKIGIIDDAADLSESGANALLKMLEEPAGKSIIILITQFPNILPNTIISRCQVIRFKLVGRSRIAEFLEQQGCSQEEALRITAAALGRPGRALDYFNHSILFDKHEEHANDFFKLRREGLCYRFSFIQKYLGTKSRIDQSNRIAELINLWITVIRDALLYKENNREQIINLNHSSELKKISDARTNSDLLKEIQSLIALRDSLDNNINPKLALENYLINL